MENVKQPVYQLLDPKEVMETDGGFFDPWSLLSYVADTLSAMVDDPNCGCGGGTVYYP